MGRMLSKSLKIAKAAVFSVFSIFLTLDKAGAQSLQEFYCATGLPDDAKRVECSFSPRGDATLRDIEVDGGGVSSFLSPGPDEIWNSVLIVLDESPQHNQPRGARSAVRDIVTGILRGVPDASETGILGVGSGGPRWISTFAETSEADIEAIEGWRRDRRQTGFTLIFALEEALDALKARSGVSFKDIILLTDGEDEAQPPVYGANRDRIVRRAAEEGVRISAITLPFDASTELGGLLSRSKDIVLETGGVYQKLQLYGDGAASEAEQVAQAIAKINRRSTAYRKVLVSPPDLWDGTPIRITPVVNRAGATATDAQIEERLVPVEAPFPPEWITAVVQPEPEAQIDPETAPEDGIDATEPLTENPDSDVVAEPPLPWMAILLGLGGLILLATALFLRSRRDQMSDVDDDAESLFDGSAAAPGEGRLNGTLVVIGNDEKPIEVRSDKFSIGRGPENDLRLNNESVSRQHCIILRHRDGYMAVQDHGSLNGVRLNGTPVKGIARIEDPGIIELGEVRIRFQATPSA